MSIHISLALSSSAVFEFQLPVPSHLWPRSVALCLLGRVSYSETLMPRDALEGAQCNSTSIDRKARPRLSASLWLTYRFVDNLHIY